MKNKWHWWLTWSSEIKYNRLKRQWSKYEILINYSTMRHCRWKRNKWWGSARDSREREGEKREVEREGGEKEWDWDIGRGCYGFVVHVIKKKIEFHLMIFT